MSTAVKVEAPSAARVVVGRIERVRRGKWTALEEDVPKPAAEPRPAGVALTLALAHRIQRAIDAGEIRDQMEAARKLGTTRARITQLLDLTLLATDLQLRILGAEAIDSVKAMSERELRKVAHTGSWVEQRIMWRATRPI